MGKFDHFIQEKFLRQIRLKAIIKILKKLPAGTVLDVGCMDDYILKRLPKKFDYYGIDDNPLSKNPKITKMRIENIPKDKKYDIVMATEILEHLDNPVDGMKKLKELSRRFVLISVPNEPFFSMFRLFYPAREHLWTIFPSTFEKQFGKPIFKTRACFNRTYIALWDIQKRA